MLPYFAKVEKSIISTDDGILKVKHTTDFKVTGDGSAANWKNVEWIKLPQRSGKIFYETQVKMLHSDSGIYCLYRCEDRKITATMKGDFLDIYKEDVVEAFFWTDETLPIYFEYELSPLNYELPILVPNIKGNFYGWRPWHYEGSRRTKHATHVSKNKIENTVSSWTAEFFIPYRLLNPMSNVPPQKGTRWRANFYRIDYDSGEASWEWQPVSSDSFHDYQSFGVIEFD